MNVKIRELSAVLILSIVFTSCNSNINAVGPERPNNNDSAATTVIAPSPASQETPLQTFPVCIEVPNASICIVEIIATQQDTKLMLELLVDSNHIEAGGLAFILSDTEKAQEPLLLDEIGNSIPWMAQANDLIVEFDAVRRVYKQTLVFDAIQSDSKDLTLKIPLVSLKVLSEGSFQVDLGADPQPGEVLSLNTSFSIGEQDFNLTRAEFEGDGTNSLRVTMYSEPIDLPDEIAYIQPLLGPAEGISVGFGSKTIVDGWPFRAFADLISQPGQDPVSGVIIVPVEGMLYNYRGPFEINFQLP